MNIMNRYQQESTLKLKTLFECVKRKPYTINKRQETLHVEEPVNLVGDTKGTKKSITKTKRPKTTDQ